MTRRDLRIMMMIGFIAILVVNVVLFSNLHSLPTDSASGASSFISPDFFDTFSHTVGGEQDYYPPLEYREKDSQVYEPTPRNLSTTPNEGRLRPSRILVGILSCDSFNDRSYRRRHRRLFQLWNDTRVCSLPEYEATQNPSCELIWTFIVGGNNNDPNAPTEIVNSSYPILATKPIQTKHEDINDPDVSPLNIRENMNKGKSQTFLYFASTLMDKYDGIDYAMKCDADSILLLHDFFKFAHKHLPPKPYNTGIHTGALRDKNGWPKHKPEDVKRFESHFSLEHDGVHIYIAGQCYILSHDLAAAVAKEAPNSASYVEGAEDHDISAMAFHTPIPVHLIVIAKSQRFWEHPVKGETRWKRIWKRESSRMQGVPFEGKLLEIY